jgi:hypothetical protein
MKITFILAIGALGARAAATPAADALEALQPRADKWCRLHDSVDPPGHCRTCASTHCESIKNIQKSDNFGVQCFMNGDKANNNQSVVGFGLRELTVADIVDT